jgi:DNA-binding MarR family transcriptional regulator
MASASTGPTSSRRSTSSRQKLIRREIDAHDRRRRRINLTPAGLRKLHAGLRAAEQADHDVLGTLEPQQLDTLRETILHAYRSSQPKP